MSGQAQIIIHTTDESQTQQVGRLLGQLAQAGDLICLTGELGTGKTTFIQGIGQGLQVTEAVTSPSFTIIHQHQGRLPFYHIDLYRLSPDQVLELGLEEYLQSQSVVAIEWADRLPGFYCPDRLSVHLSFLPEHDHRQFQLTPQGDRAFQLLQALQARWKEALPPPC